MKESRTTFKFRGLRIGLYAVALAALLMASGSWSTVNVSANHPVLVEGNCDSPVPGTTIVSPGTCGDYDGDGRIGTAEDTDGADRIFGTLRAALGPGTGAAAGTGANQNGRVTIVTSGRFATENLLIGVSIPAIPDQGVANPGNVTIEAAPGVAAIIDAVLQGDPAGGNTARQGQVAILVNYTATDRVVTLRNLVIRNYQEGIGAANNSRVNIDNCRLESNRDYGVQARDSSRIVITNSHITATGFRVPAIGVGNPAAGVWAMNNSFISVSNTNISHNAGPGLFNNTTGANNIVVFQVSSYFNNPDVLGTISIAPSPNFSN